MDAAGLGLSSGLAVADLCLRIYKLLHDMKELNSELPMFMNIVMSIREAVLDERHSISPKKLGAIYAALQQAESFLLDYKEFTKFKRFYCASGLRSRKDRIMATLNDALQPVQLEAMSEIRKAVDDGFRQAAKAQAYRSCKECSACRKLQDVTARAPPRTSEASKTTGLPYTQTVQRKAATFEKLPMDLYPSKVAEGADSLLRADTRLPLQAPKVPVSRAKLHAAATLPQALWRITAGPASPTTAKPVPVCFV